MKYSYSEYFTHRDTVELAAEITQPCMGPACLNIEPAMCHTSNASKSGG